MGKSRNSHGTKSDKETQSPMLKIFRDMMQRENVNSEKAKLLKEKKKHKKRKQYSTSKSDMVKSGDSSANDQIKSKWQYNVQGQKGPPTQSHTHSYPFASDKKESWWFWGDSKNEENVINNDDSCSCGSCALKRLIGNEYACVGCLLFLFTISVVCAFLLVCHTVPIATAKLDDPSVFGSKISNVRHGGHQASDALKRTIDMLTDKKDFRPNLRGRRDGYSRNFWDISLSRQLGELDSLSDMTNDFGGSGLQELNVHVRNGIVDPARAGNVVEARKITDEHLKNFYRKLIQTDMQIKNLKSGYFSKLSTSVSPFNLKQMPSFFPERLKRSLLYKKPFVEVTVKNQNGTEIKETLENNLRVKRFHNGSIVPSGFVFEKKKLFVQYMPVEKKIIAKCSHAPKDPKFHEREHKHPFYKNTQRLDEMLDKFLDKSFPEIMNYDSREEKKKPCHHEPVHPKNPMQYVIDSTDRVYNKLVRPNVGRAKKIKGELMKMLIDSSLSNEKKDFAPMHRWVHSYPTATPNHHVHTYVNHVRKEGVATPCNTEPTENYDLVLSISTLISPISRRGTKLELDNVSIKPGRKLQQFDEDEEDGVGYDDLKEVLSDDMANHDETDRQVERRKRDDDCSTYETKTPAPATKVKDQPPGVHNPNWKGPMPLYPDELNTMMEHNANKDPESEDKKDADAEDKVQSNNDTDQWLGQRGGLLHEDQESELEDVQYIEDYAKNKYDKLVQMAQAYSDYGVLDLKKEQIDKNQVSKEKEHRVKLAADDQHFSGRFFGSSSKGDSFSQKNSASTSHSKTGPESEGMRFEIRHGKPDDQPADFFKTLSKHVKIASDDAIHKEGCPSTTLMPVHSELDMFCSSERMDTTTKEEKPHEHEILYDRGLFKRSQVAQDDDTTTKVLDKKDKDVSLHFKSRNLKFIDAISDYNTGDLFQVTENIDSKQEVTSKVRAKRNVKSIDIDIEKIVAQENSNVRVNTTTNVENVTNIVNITEDFSSYNTSVNETKVMNKTENINVAVKQNNTKNSVLDASQFFMMLSNWFSTLSLLANETGTLKNTQSNATNKTLQSNLTTNNSTTDKTTVYLEYPLYDADMIDNIGHRSRVLLSIEELTNVSDVKTVDTKTLELAEICGGRSTNTLTVTVKTNYEPTKPPNKTTYINATNIKENIITIENKRDINKTVVKRNAENGNLIFWNDMYDEEYGIQQDPLDNTVGGKHSLEKGLLKKPKKWLQDRVKQLTDNVKKYSNKKREKKTILSHFGITFPNIGKAENMFKSVTPVHSIVKRNGEIDEDDTEGEQLPPPDKKINFSILTDHMKKVLKDAAAAVEHTKSLEMHEDTETDHITAGLMQQLVKMMSELVDFQVQQRTCIRLPNDLRTFLTWLLHAPGTGPDSNIVSSRPIVIEEVGTDEPAWKEEQSTVHMDMVVNPSSENEEPDSRSECLGTLQNLHELMQQYNDMTEEDKNKMTGVKEYLEYQMNFLNKQLTNYEQFRDTNIYSNTNPYRYKRDIETNIEKPQMYIHRKRGKRRKHMRLKRKLNRFLRNYGKKHTRTTANNIEFLVSTDFETKRDKVVVSEEQDQKLKREVKNGEEDKLVNKRNLIDVYYKALEDSKKSSTEKIDIKKDFGFDKAAVVRIQI